MVLFVDRSSLASVVKLLCLMMNLLICSWSKESHSCLTPCCPEDGGSVVFQNIGQLYNIMIEKVVTVIRPSLFEC